MTTPQTTQPQSTPPTPAPTSALNGQVIGQAHYATRAVLDRALAGTGVEFHQSVLLAFLERAEGSAEREAVIAWISDSLKTGASAVEEIIADAARAGLVTDGERVAATEDGRTRYAAIRTAFATEVTPRLYGGIPEEELAIAGRVLTLVTERANAVLAAGDAAPQG